MPADAANDQARTVTPGQAASEGATYVVIGRAVTRADDPVSALAGMRAQLALA
jgi:orotidine-5'-phosphate decarboxylase